MNLIKFPLIGKKCREKKNLAQNEVGMYSIAILNLKTAQQQPVQKFNIILKLLIN